jgi:hypothetical protein
MTDKAQSETHSLFWQKEKKTIYFFKPKSFSHNKQSLILIIIHDVLQSEKLVNIMK